MYYDGCLQRDGRHWVYKAEPFGWALPSQKGTLTTSPHGWFCIIFSRFCFSSRSDTWTEESQTTCPSMTTRTPSRCRRSQGRVTYAPATAPPTCTSCASPTPASSSHWRTCTGYPEPCSPRTPWCGPHTHPLCSAFLHHLLDLRGAQLTSDPNMTNEEFVCFYWLQVLNAMCKQGYLDALQFLKRNGKWCQDRTETLYFHNGELYMFSSYLFIKNSVVVYLKYIFAETVHIT